MFNYVKEFFSPEKDVQTMSSSSSSSSPPAASSSLSLNNNLSAAQTDYFGEDDSGDEANIGEPSVHRERKRVTKKWIKKVTTVVDEDSSGKEDDDDDEEEEDDDEEKEEEEDDEEESGDYGDEEEDEEDEEDDDVDVDMDGPKFKECLKAFALAQGVTQRNALYRMMVFLYFGKHDDIRNDQLHLEPAVIDLSISADSPPTPSWISSGVHSDLMGADADIFLKVVSKRNR
jgi:hypothetical protein